MLSCAVYLDAHKAVVAQVILKLGFRASQLLRSMQVPMTPIISNGAAQDGRVVHLEVSGRNSKFVFNFTQRPKRSHPYAQPVHFQAAPSVTGFPFSGGFPHPGGGPAGAVPVVAAPAVAAPAVAAHPADAASFAHGAPPVATDPADRAAVHGDQTLAAVHPPLSSILVAGMGAAQGAAAGDENHVAIRKDGGDTLAGAAQTDGASHEDPPVHSPDKDQLPVSSTTLAHSSTPDAKKHETDVWSEGDAEGGEEEEPEVDEEVAECK